MKRAQLFWALCLLVAVSLFLASLVTNDLTLLFCAGSLATLTYFKGDALLFSEYNQRRAQRKKQLQQLLDKRRKKHD